MHSCLCKEMKTYFSLKLKKKTGNHIGHLVALPQPVKTSTTLTVGVHIMINLRLLLWQNNLTGSTKSGQVRLKSYFYSTRFRHLLIILSRSLILLTTLNEMATSTDVHENVKVILFLMAKCNVQNFFPLV